MHTRTLYGMDANIYKRVTCMATCNNYFVPNLDTLISGPTSLEPIV